MSERNRGPNRTHESEEPATSGKANGLDSKGADAGANNVHVAWPTPAIKREMQDDFAEAVAGIVGAFDHFTKADALEYAARALGVTAAKWLFIHNPIGLSPESEDRTSCFEFFAATIIGNPVFANPGEAEHAAALALDTFGSAFDEMIAAYAATGGRA